jgi:hypothetical protein
MFSRPAAVAVTVIIGLVVVMYVLSVGPALWLAGKGVIGNSTIATTYGPLTQAAHCCRPLDLFLQWYSSKWRQQAPFVPAVQVAPIRPVVATPGIPSAPLPTSLRPPNGGVRPTQSPATDEP